MAILEMVVKKALTLILLEAALETVPPAIADHPAVLKTARRRGKRPTSILLDASLHYHAMKKLDRAEKRGRPDIVHISLLEVLDSVLCRNDLVRVYVHTIEGHAIFIDPATRIPRNYNRFVGLMEQLFETGHIPPGSQRPLIFMKTMRLDDLIKVVGLSGLTLLSERCEYKPVSHIVDQALRENLAIGIGAFQHGDFEEDTVKSAKYCYSIYKEPLSTHIVVSRVIASAERLLGVLEI